MHTKYVISIALSVFATSAPAGQYDVPYALSAVHEDNLRQLDQLAQRPGEIGAAARAAADLMAAQNAAQEQLVLPLLSWADAATNGRVPAEVVFPAQARLEADLSRLYDGDVDLVTALVELQVVAEDAGDSEAALSATRMIWHETSDLQLLYPAAQLVSAAMMVQ